MANHIAIPKVTHYGTVSFGADVACEAVVLSDGRRGFIQRQLFQAIGFHGKNPSNRIRGFLAEIAPNALKIYEESEQPILLPHGGHASQVVKMPSGGGGVLTASITLAYAFQQVLNTPQTALPRNVIAVFLCLIGFAPMGDGSVRKADRTSVCVCSTSPAIALNSMALSLANRSNPL